MRKADLIRSIEVRVPFRVAQRMLRSCGFPSAQTWPAIKEKLGSAKKKLNYKELNIVYLQSLVASEKSVAAFNVTSEVRESLLTKLAAIEPDGTNNFTKKYPYVLDANYLAKTASGGTVFVAKEPLPFGISAIFSTVRVTEHKEKILSDKMPAMLKREFAEFFGIRKSFHQSYDAVIIPASGDHVWVSVDCPLHSNHEYPEFAHIAVRNAFNKLVGQNILVAPVNLYPLIGELYGTVSEGMVIALSHLVSTSSVKHEKMRNGTCLREELFHKAGSDAVEGNINPFSIGISWTLEAEEVTDIEIHVEGTSKDASKIAPVVETAVVRKCSKAEELDFALDKILSYIKAPSQ